MLPHRVKTLKMSIGPAKHRKGVGNILDIHKLCLRVQRVKHLFGMGHNFTHKTNHLSSL
jgi:hypothetical protein